MAGKRLFDIVLVFLGVPIWAPLFLTIAVLVRVNIGTPIFFRQKRPGMSGRIFELIKFRSMRDDRDSLGQSLPDAKRLTPFGSWLRGSSLDELPELVNVLRGEMSLVGPRPLLVHYLPHYSAEQSRRHDVLPGITGWAQINGRNAIGWDQKFKLDVWYVDHQSLALDVRILLLTLVRVFDRSGVNAPGEATSSEFVPRSSTGSSPSSEILR
jgi:lipopolysaccharide/colanic/teichoic acid biosynthesis glycosyltransferase